MSTNHYAPARRIAYVAMIASVAATMVGAALANAQSVEPPTIIAFESGSPRIITPSAPEAETQDRLRMGDQSDLAPLAAKLRDMAPKGAIWNAYAENGFDPVWSIEATDGGRDWSKAHSLFAASGVADAHAAAPMPASALRLRDQLHKADRASIEEMARLDIAITRAFIHFAETLHGGVIDPSSATKNIDVARPLLDYGAALRVAHGSMDMRDALNRVAPQTAEYAALLNLYDDLRVIAASGDWGVAPHAKRSIRPHDRGPVIAALRARLVALGDLAPNAPQSWDPATGEALYDGALQQAVMAFQERHGLVADGVVGDNTLSEMAVSAAERARQVAVNLERVRWLNKPLGRRHVKVNIANFHVELIDGGRPIFESAVVVGKARKHETPEFSDEMTHVVINPKWHVPYSIATKELLPIFQNDPGEVYRRNMQIVLPGDGYVDPYSVDWHELSRGYFPYQLQQRSGPGNALGRVKFIFPNEHSVYLHDTPSKSLFSQPVRDFSHGCVRVARPEALAETLLGLQEVNPLGYFERLAAAPGEDFVELEQVVPVHIIYRTAWFDRDGALQLRRDIYGRDTMVANAMQDAGVIF